jgi:hypothetical protein
MTALTLNRRLAELTGWTNIIELGGALLGTPPAGQPQCRGQAEVPNWAGDWRDCGPLMSTYRIDVEQNRGSVIASHDCHRTLCRQVVGDEDFRDAAGRLAIIEAVIAKLEASQ